MNAMKTLPELDDRELFGLVRLLANNQKYNSAAFLITLAEELRRRALYVTEDYVIQLAARTINA